MNLSILVLLVVCVDRFLAAPNTYMDRPQRFCGSMLSIELSMLCNGRYNEDPRIKHKKFKRGIVDECCTIPCTRNYLKTNYCGPQPETSTIMTTTTEAPNRIVPVDYSSYYYALIGRVLGISPS